MDATYFFSPPITSGVIAAVLGIALLLTIFFNRDVIGRTFGQLRNNLFSRAGFFWTVNVIFMAVSVLHAGAFFGITGNGHDVPGVAQYLGFAVSFFLDLVTIILMQALLEAKYRAEDLRARQFLIFISICCGTSTFANLAISLNDFDPQKFLPHAPVWIQAASPYVLASFPLFVILMSIAAEMIVNVRPLDRLNEDEYEADEKKRIKLLQIRNEYLQKQADEELRTFTIRATMTSNKQLRRGKLPKSFRWFWEKSIDIDAVVAGVTASMRELYEPQIAEMKQRLQEINQEQQNSSYIEATEFSSGLLEISQNSTSTLYPNGQSSNGGLYSNGPSTSGLYSNGQSTGGLYATGQSTGGFIALDPEVMEVVQRYPKVSSEWLERNRKSASIEEVMEVTGHSRQTLMKAPFQRSRNRNSILIKSVVEWLKTAPAPGNTDAFPAIKGPFYEVQEQDPFSDAFANGHAQ